MNVSEQKSISVSLSRAHKLAERLKVGASRKYNEAFSKLQPRQVLSSILGTVSEELEADLQKGLTLLEEARSWNRAYSELRAAIGEANQKYGVNALLAKHDAINREMSWLQGVVQEVRPGAVSIESAKGATFDSAYVNILVLPREAQNKLEDKLSELRREAFEVSDLIAAANTNKVTVALPPEVLSQII
jgi:hypothetical protein